MDIIPKLTYTIESTPWYFGAYLNMARHNVYLLINHLTEKFSHLKYEKLKDDKEIKGKNILTEIFDTTKSDLDEERFRIYKYLVRGHYLPFIKVYSDSKGNALENNPLVYYDRLHQFINNSFALLVKFRDAFSHYLALDEHGNSIDSRQLNIDHEIAHDLETIFQDSLSLSASRFYLTQQESDFEHLKHYALFKETETKLSENGFYFFICLFLEKQYAIKFLKKIKGFKNETIPAFRATLLAFTHYTIRIPDIRLDNDEPRMGVLMEMLNELQKCPIELYKRLTDEDKKKFEPALDEESQLNLILNSTANSENLSDEQTDSLLIDLTTLKRHQNRFSYFALRCIDELNLLPGIHFQITVGKIELRAYPKVIGKVATNRRILKEVNAFGKLSAYEGKENWFSQQLKMIYEDENLVFDQYNPHYNIQENKIAFYVLDSGTSGTLLPLKKKNTLPTGFLSLNDLPKLIVRALNSPGRTVSLIKDFIAKNENIILNEDALVAWKEQLHLDPAVFTRRIIKENALRGKEGIAYLTQRKTDALFKRYKALSIKIDSLAGLKKLIDQLHSKKDKEYISQIVYTHFLNKRKDALAGILPKGLPVNQLPLKVINYLLSLETVGHKKKFLHYIKEEKRTCKTRLKALNKQENNAPKIGEIATFLARDIINMVVNEETKQNITSAYYNRLQNKIAYFSISKPEIAEMLTELNLFDKKTGHPFLDKGSIMASSGILAFYEYYLVEKAAWIDKQILHKNQLKKDLESHLNKLPFAYARRYQKNNEVNFTKWLINKKVMPVNIPNNLFDADVNKILKDSLRKMGIAFKDTEKFALLLSKSMMGDTQPFYTYKREYTVDGEKIPFYPANQSGKDIKTDYGKHADASEKEIRFIQTQDRVIKLLCRNIIQSIVKFKESNLDIILNNIYPFSETSVLNAPQKFEFTLPKNGKKKIIVAEDTSAQKEQVLRYKGLSDLEERKQYNGQKGYQWTIKDFGRFKRFVHDRRLSEVLDYIDAPNATFDLLAYQLDEYDRYRVEIFQQTFDFEKAIAIKHLDRVKHFDSIDKAGKKGKIAEVSFRVYLDVLKELKILATDEADLLKNVRNKFSHSEFPPFIKSLTKITSENIASFEANKFTKDAISALDISVPSKILNEYKAVLSKFS